MRWGLAALFLLLLATRLLQWDLVWVEEGYPTAAGIQLLDGETLYRDIWFDKPPLFPLLYVLWGARTGVALRVAGAVFVFLCCLALFRFARDLWGEREGLLSAGLLGFFLTLGIPAAVMVLAPDLLMVLPHIVAVWLAWRGRVLWGGVAAGAAMLLNTKAVFVVVACIAMTARLQSVPLLLAGFAIPNAAMLAWLAFSGALAAYYEQVWTWGMLYSRSTFLRSPLAEGIVRTANWAGFHAAIVAPAAWLAWRTRAYRFLLWIAIAAAGVAAGWRFFPRYYFLLLPPFCLLAARAITQWKAARVAVALLLLIPLVRFGPRLVNHAHWSDLAMMEDSRAAAQYINGHRRPKDTLLVWGYRPDMFAFTRMKAGTRFLDSQPLTGVIADRHLTNSDPAAPDLAARNRQELQRTKPDFVVDGLGPYNARLAITNYPDLSAWLARYEVVSRTAGTVIYHRKPD